jgi:hypothetical protein
MTGLDNIAKILSILKTDDLCDTVLIIYNRTEHPSFIKPKSKFSFSGSYKRWDHFGIQKFYDTD